jgi:hypothetical protein
MLPKYYMPGANAGYVELFGLAARRCVISLDQDGTSKRASIIVIAWPPAAQRPQEFRR